MPAAGTVRRPKTDAMVAEGESSGAGDLINIDAILEQNETRSRPSSSAALGPIEIQQQTVTLSKKRKAKKKRGHGSGSDSNNKVVSQPHHHPSRTESSMVMAFDEQIKRDLSSGRILARELRILRAERVKCDTLRRGTASLEAALARHDPYAKELVRERYGFIHRVECALCTFPFLPVNLPHRVSFKCIMDLHEFWGYTPPQREVAARYRPPLCYDAVRVCRMCGPILFQHTTATPNVYDEQLSPTMPRASSLSALATTSKVSPKMKARAAMIDAESAERRAFCSDPYALPPLFGDDVIEDGETYVVEETPNEVRGVGAGVVQDFPAKAIVYSQQQTDTVAFMSSKEWEVINPQRSNIRQVMENTIK
ncbi:LisH dimerization motif [Phytophthora cinnamomi]|uniref:LisH dimerization motif n=2 Tax=Phytophthora cinnamomi TaxID=4785 RepID=UPI003559DB15|nr:LisH dimerization motif [Phytophthora cinnamomi]